MTNQDWFLATVERIGLLFFLNGGTFEVKGVGTRPANNPLGRLGLLPGEALELCYYQGRLDSFSAEARAACQVEIQRVVDRLNGKNIAIATAEETARLLARTA